jgi:hypothetical protein
MIAARKERSEKMKAPELVALRLYLTNGAYQEPKIYLSNCADVQANSII